MSKFLKLVQENTPNESDGVGPYTIEIEDQQGNFMAKVTVPDSVSAWFDNFLEFVDKSGGYDLEVAKRPPAEDYESTSSIEQAEQAANLAAAALKLPTRKELKALKKKGKGLIMGDPIAKGAIDIRNQAATALKDLKGTLKI
tara:strand:+ start:782 stop:1207 length:426 start_codon:yes stop_codon:yes gene_type:complete